MEKSSTNPPIGHSLHRRWTIRKIYGTARLWYNIEEKLGPKATVKYFDYMNMEETQMFEMYSDNDGVEEKPDKPPKDLEPTTDLSTEVYLNVSIVFPQWYRMARG